MSQYLGQRVQRASETKLVHVVRVVVFVNEETGWVLLRTGCGISIKHHPQQKNRFLKKYGNCLTCLAG